MRVNDAKHHNAVRRFAKINSIGKLPENRPAYFTANEREG
jgi:hypothetical protein